MTQPANAVSVPGDHNSRDGVPGGLAARLRPGPADAGPRRRHLEGHGDASPAGAYAYKIAIDKTWDENYGAGGALNGGNIGYTAPGGAVTFFYDHRTKNIQNTAQGDRGGGRQLPVRAGLPGGLVTGLPARLVG